MRLTSFNPNRLFLDLKVAYGVLLIVFLSAMNPPRDCQTPVSLGRPKFLRLSRTALRKLLQATMRPKAFHSGVLHPGRVSEPNYLKKLGIQRDTLNVGHHRKYEILKSDPLF